MHCWPRKAFARGREQGPHPPLPHPQSWGHLAEGTLLGIAMWLHASSPVGFREEYLSGSGH